MAKSIHERVRAAIAKREAAERKVAQDADHKRFMAQIRRDAALEKRNELVATGQAEPRNAREQRIADRFVYGLED